ncbi:antibiotic biosynthesis monooxygenase [Halioglobus japonicus]|uniref:Antibiotic biosynthesis monooxygenase n=1 Tax=Halioglobus japonicus TaxID=930805 RepID=A0AAP8MH53_9GAMM|nr:MULTISPECIES: putative quinol monooxygenase [Halioglobus]AQA19260.1 antibiotic biosynthesis monooxygenase [Halioglobus japonicus]KZX59079.1 antibiotic biosynthesis monooxygenase [Halioglobus sp. HI00S01]PLW87702.1 antibiotic biosynthesis monooxygenase [Halioglobus japonicus]GHD07031.1 antibiotic biosynthesis monooxygenase [Halioglobus japonicus]
MAIGLLATITVQEGKNAEFEQAFMELTAQVRANEPGNVFYALNRSTSNPQVYKVMEQYASPEALDAHSKSEHFQAANQKLAGLVAAAPEIEILDAITG